MRFYGRTHVDQKGNGCGFPVDFAGLHPQSFPRPAQQGHNSPTDGPLTSNQMQQLYPHTEARADPLQLYPSDHRPTPSERPWVMANMVASTDGAIAIDGVSGGLGGEGDQVVFRAIRASCDWIVVAAGTASAERYGVPRPGADVIEQRVATGRARAARLAVVTASVSLDPSLPMFADQRAGEALPLVITGADPPPDRVAAIGDRAEWTHLDAPRPTPEMVMAELFTRGARVVLAEGGPSFNGQLVDAGLVDELCITISPQLVGGTSSRIVSGASHAKPAELRLGRLLEHDGALFARYVRT